MSASRAATRHFRALERMYLSAPINHFFQPTLRVTDQHAVIAVTARRELYHAAHAVHGSVYFKLLDDAAFFAAQSLVTATFVLTTSFQLDLLRPVTEGVLTARGRVVHRSNRILVAEAELRDDARRLVARGSGMFLPSAIPLDASVGYVIDTGATRSPSP